MYNFHPACASFPFALLFTLLALEIAYFVSRNNVLAASTKVFALAACGGVIAAFFSGYQGNDFANGDFKISEDLIVEHHVYGRVLLFVVVPCLALKFFSAAAKFNKQFFVAAYFVFLISSVALAGYTSFLGGELVFKHGAGVKIDAVHAAHLE